MDKTPSEDHNALSAEEFQAKLYHWFENRGLLSQLRTHLRCQMIVALRDTSLYPQTPGNFRQAGSPKLQAINLLLAEFLLQQEYHYTLSVFTSEVPLLRNLPEFSTSISDTVRGKTSPHGNSEGYPRFQRRDVCDILQAIGLSPNSLQGNRACELYESKSGEPLLHCILRSMQESSNLLPNTNSTNKLQVIDDTKSFKQRQVSPLQSKLKIEAVKQLELFSTEMKSIILQSSLSAEHIKQFHNELERCMGNKISEVQQVAEKKFHEELVRRERRIQTEMIRHEDEIHSKLNEAEKHLEEQRHSIDCDLNKKQTHLTDLAAQLQQQQKIVTQRLEQVEEQREILHQKELELEKVREEEIALAERKSSEILQLEQQLQNLNKELEEKELIKTELEKSRQRLDEASHALTESQSEVTFLRNLHEHAKKHPVTTIHGASEKLSGHVQVLISELDQDTKRNKSNVHNQTRNVTYEDKALQTHSEKSSGIQNAMFNLEQLSMDNSQRGVYDTLSEMLQQENYELRGHVEEQRARIDELTSHAAQLVNQLENVQTNITLLNARTMDSNIDHRHPLPPLLLPNTSGITSVPEHPPPPPAFPRTHVPSIYHSRQLGAGEELAFRSRMPPAADPELGMFQARREWRKKPPRRLMVHNPISSDDSSPTEEILQEARCRLRKLEEESEAVDRSYREFRLRHSESLAATASVLFQPLLSVETPISYTETTTTEPIFAFQHSFNMGRPMNPTSFYENTVSHTLPSFSSLPVSQSSGQRNWYNFPAEPETITTNTINLPTISTQLFGVSNISIGNNPLATAATSSVNTSYFENQTRQLISATVSSNDNANERCTTSQLDFPSYFHPISAASAGQSLCTTVYNTPQVSSSIQQKKRKADFSSLKAVKASIYNRVCTSLDVPLTFSNAVITSNDNISVSSKETGQRSDPVTVKDVEPSSSSSAKDPSLIERKIDPEEESKFETEEMWVTPKNTNEALGQRLVSDVINDDELQNAFLPIRDGDQVLQSSACLSETYSDGNLGIAISSGPLQNVSFSSIDVSSTGSDPPISAGDISNKADESW